MTGRFRFFAVLALILLLAACTDKKEAKIPEGSSASLSQMEEINAPLEDHAENYTSTYEIFVYSFCDSDQDGIGDLKGLESKLDYIKDLGFNAIWMTPVCPSPTYHKYDVKDYMSIDSQFGTLEDFDQLVSACHDKGILVITDLVLNHTSIEHPWFTQAAEYLKANDSEAVDPGGCPYVDYYHFTREFETGYASLPGTGWYYEARFWEGMPDLNLDSEAVRREIKEIMDFWISHGVDGFRLDAVTSYYTGNDDAGIAFLTWLTQAGRQTKEDLYFVAEAWTDRPTYARYYASGINSMFDFSFADSGGIIASALKGTYTARDYADAQANAHELYASYNPVYRNAPFYTNHDMSRSAGYYAGDDGSRTKLAGAMNILMSGNVYVYYGEELGMKGSGKDENKRAPMYWSTEAAPGICSGPPDMDDIEMKFPAYDGQKEDPYSIWNYYRQALHIRNAFPSVADGKVIVWDESTGTTAVYEKDDGEHEPVLLAINISDQPAEVEVGGSDYRQLAALLTVSQDRVTFADGKLYLPAYAVAILKK